MPHELIYIVPVVLIAGCVGTMTGFGSSTILIPVLLQFYPLPETLIIAGIIHWFGDLWKILLFRRGWKWKLILSFGLPGIVATCLGASAVFTISTTVASRIFGVMLIGYVIFLFVKNTFRIPPQPIHCFWGGCLSGFLAGLFGMGGAVRSLFLSAYNLPKDVYIAATGAIAFIVDSARIGVYVYHGITVESTLWWSMPVLILASFAGAGCADFFVKRIPQRHFRKIVAIFLLLAGIKLAILTTS